MKFAIAWSTDDEAAVRNLLADDVVRLVREPLVGATGVMGWARQQMAGSGTLVLWPLHSEQHGDTCAGAFGSVEEMLAQFDGEADVMLMDINLPLLSGTEGVPLLKGRHPALPIVMLMVYDDAKRIFAALKAGATGYLLKRTPPDHLLDALVDVHRGGAPMSASIARKVVDSFHAPAPEAPAELALSPREREVLHYLAQGYRHKEIAEALFISPETVRSHLRSIYDKLHVRSRTEAVVKYLGR